MKIPETWTFKSDEVAWHFDAHVREQLPWYEIATDLVAVVARHYIGPGSVVYDIGCSTGNIGRKLADTIQTHNVTFYPIDNSREMLDRYDGPGTPICDDAVDLAYHKFDFAVLFLTVMFLPLHRRASFLRRLWESTRPGGAIVVVDKIETPSGYVGTALRRMALDLKLRAGAKPEAILQKELSLAGYQRPINPRILPGTPERFFQAGEFVGWVIEKPY